MAAFALLFLIQAHTGRFLAVHTAPRSDGAVAVSPPFWKAAVGVKILKSAQEGGPIVRAALGHCGLRNG
jgi:hypothetical protein